MSTKAQRTGSRSDWRNHVARLAVLVVLLGIALLLSGHLVDTYGPALAGLVFLSPTNTPDPNSPQPTPTYTDTPWPTNTPSTPFPTNTGVLTATPTSTSTAVFTGTPPSTGTALPTNTPFPTNTPPPGLPLDTPAPTWTLPPEQAPPTSDLQSPFTSPIQPSTPSPVLGAAPPAAMPSPTIQAGDALTTSPEIVLLVRPLDQPSSAAGDSARPLDTALFIDNIVIAAGYVWTCIGALALAAGVIGGVLFLRRSQRTRHSPPAATQPPPAGSPSQGPAAPPATQRAAAPLTPRFAAHHRSADFDDLDRHDA